MAPDGWYLSSHVSSPGWPRGHNDQQGMAFDDWASAVLLARGLLPWRLRWTPLAFGILMLASVVAIALPAPRPPVSNPGGDGAVAGRCVTEAPPFDDRLPERALILAAGLAGITVGVVFNRRAVLRTSMAPTPVLKRR